MIALETKECSTCHEIKPFDEFRERGGLRKGRSSICQECGKAYGRAYMKMKRAGTLTTKKIRAKGGHPITSKICSRCKLDKPLDQFSRKSRYEPEKNYSAWSEHCKPCNTIVCRENRKRLGHKWKSRQYPDKACGWRCTIKREYGISEQQYYDVHNKQGGKCAICKLVPTELGDLHIDHDHLTGLFRGLLCGLCNRGLGLLRDSKDNLVAALKYLGG